jgi:EAL domain-containing protein (putative c-di-GMP-specific phosphodiesterase class I)/CHASE2 domain-containing sensor protein
MWSRAPRPSAAPGNPRRLTLLWAALIGLVFGLIQFGQPLEDVLRALRNAMRPHEASGEIVVVAIDERSIESLSDWPWPRSRYAALIDRLDAAGAREIAFDVGFSTRTNPDEDRSMARAIERARGKVILPIRQVLDPASGRVGDRVSGRRVELLPLPEFRRNAELVSIFAWYNFKGQVWKMPYASRMHGVAYPSLSARLAGQRGQVDELFTIDYATRLGSIPTISALDVLEGRMRSGQLSGKTVIVGTTSLQQSNIYFLPGSGQVAEVYLHTLAAETLSRGKPVEIGWLMPLVAAFGLLAIYLYAGRRWMARLALTGAIAIVFALPFAAESRLIFFDAVPAMFALLIVVSAHSWSNFRRSYRARGLTNAISGLPNLNAVREQDEEGETLLVAARVHNFAEITSALAPGSEKGLVEQIVARLGIGAAGATVYQGDEGIFVWLVPSEAAIGLGDQLEALHALCRTPVAVAGTHVDLVVTFGVDAGHRSISSRIGSALVAADEALEEGIRWKEFDAAKLKDAAWKLSLLGRLDAAIDDGEIWVAYQPKIDLVTKRLIGAEALVRWTHPEKGEIPPAEFIPAAEQHNRIEKLTGHVLNDAIRTAALVNARGVEFGVAVNLSARLLDSFEIVDRVRTLLTHHQLPAQRLTLEVTESIAMANNERSFEVLERLRALGVDISIDDYGTGFSTLEYLKRIPATEIKIDKSFVRMIDRNQSDKLMVNSTIQLAHSLGRRVVAEGVEAPETLSALEAMGCDEAQGFLIGRPMPVRNLVRLLIAERRRPAA